MRSRLLLVLMVFATVLGIGACGARRSSSTPAPSTPAPGPDTESASGTSLPTASAPPSFNCNGTEVPINPVIPPDFSENTQQAANCFAWSEFISLNWPVSALDGGTDAGFGTPGDLSPTQWQTFMSADDLFPPDGSAPPPWGTQPQVTPECAAEAGLTAEQARKVMPLMMISKFSTQFRPPDNAQAFPQNAPSWLGSQNGKAVWYEIRVSQPEYDFVANNGLYTAQGQQAWVDGGTGKPIVLPKGNLSTGELGSIELKAAWMEVTDSQDAKWNRYKLMQAIVPDLVTQKCRTATVALVGLHIIHKTNNQDTWVWATFEHVDNAPTQGQSPGTTDWNFHNPQCQPQVVNNVAPQCSPDGGSSFTIGCTPNIPPPYYLGAGCPPPVPIQVTRVTAIDSYAASQNQATQQAIAQNYPGSVWQYYQLINVLWSTNPTPEPTAPKKVPLTFQSMQPSSNTAVANTTMETYFQGIDPTTYEARHCLTCHKFASIAGTTQNPNPGWDSDFSFIFGTAADVSATGAKAVPKSSKQKVPPARQPPQIRRITR
ncbi:cytochrome c family protein [Archangium lipolyticum]|uniref:cytochrome c family protein n=1 Tax=Archangium lipolyticum TaxID=2970465 RepID=UPI00214A7928|nr:cytochrome c family protein [Archangium lipolyticum]